jgi:CBS domain-containing protein
MSKEIERATVGDVMAADVAMVSESTPFKELVRLILSKGHGAVVVVDRLQHVLGMVSDDDLFLKREYRRLEQRSWPLESPRHRRGRAKAEASIAADLMTPAGHYVHPTSSLAEAAKLMHLHYARHLPVVDERGHLQGIVSRADLLKVFMREDDEIRAQVQEAVKSARFFDPVDVRVEVGEGVVTLSGQLQRRSDVKTVVETAWGIDGVVDVIDKVALHLG